MKTFDIKRFLMVARWDMAVNSRFYTRILMLVFGGVTLPVIYRNLRYFFDGGSTVLLNDDLCGLDEIYAFFFGIFFFVMLCHTFHALLTRQGRINELTLPATNLERFSWHVLFTVVGSVAAFMLAVAVADLLHVALGFMLSGQTVFSSLTVRTWEALVFVPVQIMNKLDFSSYNDVMGALCFVLVTVGYLSTFVLGSAWKYRHTMAMVLLYQVSFSLLFSMFLSLLAGTLFKDISMVKSVIRLIEDHDHAAITAVTLLFLAGFAFVWWLAYRLYCRAQITTRTNP